MSDAKLRARALMSEDDWQAFVLDFARMNRWHCVHVFDMRRTEAGWPDLVLCRPPEIVFVELKRENGKVTPAQGRVLELLEECGCEVHVWRPSDEEFVRTRLSRRYIREVEA